MGRSPFSDRSAASSSAESGAMRTSTRFLRACDWKGLSFGKLQGLPDDRWPSRDEALTRVALGIRIIVEKWHAGDAATPVPSRMGERARQTQPVSGAPPVIESELGVIDDSGAAVLLADQYFESDSITEQEHGRDDAAFASGMAFQRESHFLLVAEIRVEKIRTDQEQNDVRTLESGVDFFSPLGTGIDPAIMPVLDQAAPFQGT
jgi:hypothetical protein